MNQPDYYTKSNRQNDCRLLQAVDKHNELSLGFVFSATGASKKLLTGENQLKKMIFKTEGGYWGKTRAVGKYFIFRERVVLQERGDFVATLKQPTERLPVA